MNDTVILERRDRRLLRWYPPSFRHQNGDEVLGVLMAGAGEGRRWPSAAEAADVLWSGLRMRFRLPPGSQKQGWTNAWAAFSVLAPVFLLLTNIVVVLVPPYVLPVRSHAAGGMIVAIPHSWLQFFGNTSAFCMLLLFQAAAVIAVLAGWRWVALAVTLGSAWYMLTGPGFAQYPLPVGPLTAAWFILEPLALLASPGPRRGRALMTCGHGAVLVLAVGAVKLSSLTWFVIGLRRDGVVGNRPLAEILLIAAAVLAVAAVAGPAVLRQGGRMSVLMAVLLYPYPIEFASIIAGPGALLMEPTPLHLAILFLMPLVMAVFTALIAARRRLTSSDVRLTPGN